MENKNMSNPFAVATLTQAQEARFTEVLAQWQFAVDAKHSADGKRDCAGYGYTHDSDKVHYHVGGQYVRMDIRTSGAFMIHIETGVVYGIKGYGKVNKAKNSGNIYDPGFNGSVLLRDHFRYGNFENAPDGTPTAMVR
jgi:hypothetical protein